MGCIEKWRTIERYDSNDNLIIEVEVPNNCFVSAGVGDKLPPGVTPQDLCNYQTGDYIIVITVEIESGCTPTQQDVILSNATDYKKDGSGEHFQMVVYNKTNGKVKTRKRSIGRIIPA